MGSEVRGWSPACNSPHVGIRIVPTEAEAMSRSARKVLLAVSMTALAITLFSHYAPLVKHMCPTLASAIWGS